MKRLLLGLAMALPLFAYDVGDRIDASVQERLGISDSKHYVIDVFASWCRACSKQMPQINALHDRLNPDRVEMIGLCIDKEVKHAKKFIQAHHIKFKTVLDPKQRIVSTLNPVGFPALFIIKNMTVQHIIAGAHDDVDRLVVKYLEGAK